ncbi:MAG: ribonuclease [Firmicutes bacterium]|nr:ribonuclease [Bacillota bacterium]
MKKLISVLCILVLVLGLGLSGCAGSGEESDSSAGSGSGSSSQQQESKLDRDGIYDSKEDVKNYLIEYGELPSNYITKSEARELGWEGGSVERYAEYKCIGGDRFGNYEGLLPKESDKDFYHECDIKTLGKNSRGAKRIIYGKDGDIYYTDDHYESFTKIYDAE